MEEGEGEESVGLTSSRRVDTSLGDDEGLEELPNLPAAAVELPEVDIVAPDEDVSVIVFVFVVVFVSL